MAYNNHIISQLELPVIMRVLRQVSIKHNMKAQQKQYLVLLLQPTAINNLWTSYSSSLESCKFTWHLARNWQMETVRVHSMHNYRNNIVTCNTWYYIHNAIVLDVSSKWPCLRPGVVKHIFVSCIGVSSFLTAHQHIEGHFSAMSAAMEVVVGDGD